MWRKRLAFREREAALRKKNRPSRLESAGNASDPRLPVELKEHTRGLLKKNPHTLTHTHTGKEKRGNHVKLH